MYKHIYNKKCNKPWFDDDCKKISVRTNPHPLINRIIRRRAKVGNKCIACGPFKH